MAIVFKTPKSTLNTTSKAIQNLGGDCPPCPEPVLESKELNYTQNGEYTVTPEQGVDGFSSIDVTVNVPSDVNNQNKSVTISSNGESTISADSGYSGLGEVTVTVDVDPVLGTTSVVPTTSLQTITPPQGYDGFDQVNVLAVDSNIDPNILSNNIKNGITILGVTGNYSGSAINNQNKTVSPSTSQQSVSADQGYTGLGTVTVNAVTSSIDNNISAGNIKKDVTILGVTGSYDPQPALANANVVPATSAQTITPPAGIDGYSRINVTAVTAAIDANIVAENILDGVTILGVTGSDLGYDAGYSDGYAQGQAECPEPGGECYTAYLQDTITTNGTYTYDPSDYQGSSYDAFDGVEITVNVPSGGCVDWASAGFNCNDLSFINEQMPVILEAKSQLDNGESAGSTGEIGNTGYTYGELILAPSGKYTQMASFESALLAGDIVSANNTGRQFFMYDEGLSNIRSFSMFNGSAPTDLYQCFYRCYSLHKSPTIDASAATNVQSMYEDCRSLTSGFPTSFTSAQNCSSIFKNNFEVTNYPALSFPSATTLANAFDVSGKTPNRAYDNRTFTSITTSSALTNCASMFQANGMTTCPVFNTENVTDFRLMFSQCTNLTAVPALDYGKGQNFAQFV